MPGNFFTAAIAGTVVGYALNLTAASTMKYIAALILVFAVRKLLVKKEKSWGRGIVGAISALVSLLVPTGLLAFYSGFQVYDVVMAFAESVLSACAAFFLVRAIHALERRESLSLLRSGDLIAVLLSFGILVVAVSSFTISGFFRRPPFDLFGAVGAVPVYKRSRRGCLWPLLPGWLLPFRI